MSAPKRIQLRRTKGWRKPDGAITVARPSKWGNPFKPGQVLVIDELVGRREGEIIVDPVGLVTLDLPAALALYRCDITSRFSLWTIKIELAGHDLGCWCPLDQACHADVLLELANT